MDIKSRHLSQFLSGISMRILININMYFTQVYLFVWVYQRFWQKNI